MPDTKTPVVKLESKNNPTIIIIGIPNKEGVQKITIPQEYERHYQELLESIDKFLKAVEKKK